jgi:hypothetical protein
LHRIIGADLRIRFAALTSLACSGWFGRLFALGGLGRMAKALIYAEDPAQQGACT